MGKHHSKTKRREQLELFGSSEFRTDPGTRSWFVTHPNGKPNRSAMHGLHKRFSEEGKRREQRELARFLSGTPHRNISLLLSDFEATKELDGAWEATKVMVRSLKRFPRSHDLRYRLHYLHMEMDNLGVAAHWLAEAIRVERLITPERKPKRPGSSKKKPDGKMPRLVDRGAPRSINYFFYACPFTWGEEKLDDDWDEDIF